jgi:membrane peptidoglycan carboxypeptidase
MMRRLRARHFTNAHGHTDWKKIGILAAIASGAIIVFFGILFATALAILSIGLPDVKDLDSLAVAQSTTIYDREGNVLYVKFGEENREYKTLNQISENLVKSTIAIEDAQFYSHPGFDMVGFTRAAFNNLTGGSQQGGSTITQQYIKLTFLTPEKSYVRKLKELILAVRLEEAFDKDTIIEKYLNKIPYGNNAFGAEKAAQVYFNKPAKELTIGEAAILAAIPQAPSTYNPYGPNQFSHLSGNLTPENLQNRNIREESDLHDNEIKRGLIGQNVNVGNHKTVYLQGRSDLVLKRMAETGAITEREKTEALEEVQEIKFNKYKQDIKAPHFVLEYVMQQLEGKYGSELVEKGGLKVYTTIDPRLQEIAEEAITSRAESNENNYNAKNASLVSMNPQNGQILAMVGSRNYFDEEIEGKLNLATSFRQPGSTFKPIVYAAAFMNRYSPSSVAFDVPTPFGSRWPKNYDGQFQGPITLRKSLGQSRNITTMKTYYLAGEDKEIMPFAKKLGVNFMNEDIYYGYPLSLGTAETTLLSMTNAFGTFANGGLQYEPVSILRVENAQGEVLEEWEDKAGIDALDPQIAYLINSILSDQSVAVGPNLHISGQVNAAKTGTSNKANSNLPRDLLTIGYTTQVVTGVWVGNNNENKDGVLAASASGYTVATPIFKEFMTEALKDMPSEDFPIPEGIKQETVSKYSGKLASDLTPIDHQTTDFFASFAVPTEIDDSYSSNPDFTASETLKDIICEPGKAQKNNQVVLHDIDPSREVWENAAQEWIKENADFFEDQATMISCEDVPLSELPTIKITNLKDDEVVRDKTKSVEIKVTSEAGVTLALYFLDGTLQYKQDQSPFSGNIRLPKNSSAETHTLTILVYDNEGRIGQKEINIRTSVAQPEPTEPSPEPTIPSEPTEPVPSEPVTPSEPVDPTPPVEPTEEEPTIAPSAPPFPTTPTEETPLDSTSVN